MKPSLRRAIVIPENLPICAPSRVKVFRNPAGIFCRIIFEISYIRLRSAVAFLLILFAVMPSLALEKVGSTSMQVLKFPIGVRGIGMGNALTADARDVEAVWWNPGALTEIKKNQVVLTQVNMPAKIQLNSIAFGHRWGELGAWSVHVINLFTDDMKVRTWENPNPPDGTGLNFNAYDFILGVGYARKLTDKFSLGGNLRYLRSALEETTYDGVSVDLGTLYKTGLRSMRLAMAIQNLGPDVKYSGEYLDYRNKTRNDGIISTPYEGASLPTMFRLGIAFDVFEMLKLKHSAEHAATFAAEMNHPNDNRERLNLGGEYGYKNTLFLRAGGKLGYDEESVAGGFGLKFPVIGNYTVKFDYAYSHWGRLTQASDGFAAQPHRFALGFEW
jgi:opacity protein-like surface antigen